MVGLGSQTAKLQAGFGSTKERLSVLTRYQDIFRRAESTLIRVGSEGTGEEKFRRTLDEFKSVETKKFVDSDYFQILMYIPFYSGFKTDTVNHRIGTIRKHFPDYRTVAAYDEKKVSEILDDSEMIRNRKKIQACVDNARTFKVVMDHFGSFQEYVDTYSPRASFENLMSLRQDLTRRFGYLGKITAYHFLTEIGMPVLKPDRVIRRVFYRLGLVESEGESEEQLLKVVSEGQKFARETGHPIRYIDIVFVAYGQMRAKDGGIEQGICVKDKPRCGICGMSDHCDYFSRGLLGNRR